MKTCVYPGSFQILTLGHTFIIDSSLEVFDKVYIAIATNSTKDSYTNYQERLEMIKNIYGANERVEIVPFKNQLIVNFCLNNNIDVLVRGLRNSADLDYEKQISFINNSISNKIKTIYFAPPTELANISSSLVKSLIHLPESQFIIEKLIPKENMKYINRMRFGDGFVKIIKKLKLNIDGVVWEDFYSAKGRYYHTLQHVTEVLESISGRFGYDITLEAFNWKETALWIAALFHDIIYDPLSHDNEEKSADEFKKYTKTDRLLSLPKEAVDFVCELILATKLHVQTDNKFANTLIDADLSILASDPIRFNEYEKQIRAEYAIFGDKEYKNGRIEFVEKMLDRPTIFLTNDYKKYEYKAKRNLMKLLEKLQKD